MRREGGQQLEKSFQHGNWFCFPRDGFVHEHHHRRNRGVEAHPVEVFGDFLDARVQRLELRRSRRHVFDGRTQLDQVQQFSASLRLCGGLRLLELSLTLLVHEQTPRATEKFIDAGDAIGVPRLHHFERTHEHFVKAERIRAILREHVVGIYHIAARLGHLLTVFAEDKSLIDEFEKRFGRGDVAEVEQNLVPEPRVEQMQHGVLRAADVEVNALRIVAADVSRRILFRWRGLTSAATHPIGLRVTAYK